MNTKKNIGKKITSNFGSQQVVVAYDPVLHYLGY